MAMELQPQDIGVGCILRPRREVDAPRTRSGPPIVGPILTGVPCQWRSLMDRGRKINRELDCPDGFKLTTKGQDHPITVIQIKGNDISYVQMTGTKIKNEKSGTEYFPVGHYFPTKKDLEKCNSEINEPEIHHPKKYRSRYWLRGPNQWEAGTINAAPKEICHGILGLEEHSYLRLPHVYTQKLDRFKAFRGDNAQAMAYRLDESSYHRLMDRLGLPAGNYTSDVAPKAPPRQATPPTATWPCISASNNSSDSSIPLYPKMRTKNGPSQAQRRYNLGRTNNHSPSS